MSCTYKRNLILCLFANPYQQEKLNHHAYFEYKLFHGQCSIHYSASINYAVFRWLDYHEITPKLTFENIDHVQGKKYGR